MGIRGQNERFRGEYSPNFDISPCDYWTYDLIGDFLPPFECDLIVQLDCKIFQLLHSCRSRNEMRCFRLWQFVSFGQLKLSAAMGVDPNSGSLLALADMRTRCDRRCQ